MDKTQIELDEFVFALEWHSDEMASYLDMETGQVVEVSDLLDAELVSAAGPRSDCG
jgi:hypothetical protein